MWNDEKIKGLTPELISDIYDIVEKFGIIHEDDQTIDFKSGDFNLGYELYISRSSIPENKNLIVSKNLVMSQGSEFIPTKDGLIAWDSTLTVEEVKNAIFKIDELAKTFGLIDKDNKRIRVEGISDKPLKREEDKYRVNEIFKVPGTVFLVPPGKETEDMLNLFDHPEKLTIVGDHPKLVGLTDDIKYIEKRRNVVMELLKEKGVSMEDVKDIPLDDILMMRKEIEKRLE